MTEPDPTDYIRTRIPQLTVRDLAGRPVSLRGLATTQAALLLYAPEGDSGRDLLRVVPALLADVRSLRVHPVVTHRSELLAQPPEARRHAVMDPDRETHRRWGVQKQAWAAVLLGADGLLAGGPVYGADEVERFADDIRAAILAVSPVPAAPGAGGPDPATSIDVLIPFRNTAPDRLRNLTFTISYYRRHLPAARIILAQQDERTPLPAGVEVDLHLAVAGDPDLFNKSLLLNEAARRSRAKHLLLADADCIPEIGVLAALEGIAESLAPAYVVLHDVVHYLDAAASASFVATRGINDGNADAWSKHISMSTSGGATLCSADSFHSVGGFDQQHFLGWGGEDDDLYNRCFVHGLGVERVDAALLHLDHPSSVAHNFSEEEVQAKRAGIPAARLTSPTGKSRERATFWSANRVRLATCTGSPWLYSSWRGFTGRAFPEVHVVDGQGGHYGVDAFLSLFRDADLDACDYLLYCDEDCLVVDWAEVQETLTAFIEGGYGFAGMPDGGVISHRFHNPVAINPFWAIFDVKAVRKALLEAPVGEPFGPNLAHHWPGHLLRAWDGKTPYPRIDVVLRDGGVPYGTARDDFEPYYRLWFRLLRAGLRPLYLDARDAPEMDDDGCCTALLGTSGRVMAYHSWFARAYGHQRGQTIRINKVIQRARSHLRW